MKLPIMTFECVEAGKDDAQLMADLIAEVWRQMDHKEWFAVEDLDYISGLMEAGKALAWKMVETESGEVAGVYFAVVPGIDADNLGYDIGLTG